MLRALERCVAMGTGPVVMDWGDVAVMTLVVIPRRPGISWVQGSTDDSARARRSVGFRSLGGS